MLLRLYDRMIVGLAILAATTLGLMVFGIVTDVMLRNLGFRPFQATSALIEYTMLFATMTGAPWLVRQQGHVAITSFVDALPGGVRRTVMRGVAIVSVLVLALLSWRAALVGFEMVQTGAMDIRSIYIPAWVLYAMLSIGFGLMALEFVRLLFRREISLGSQAHH